VRRFKDTKLEDHEDALVIWMGQVIVKNGSASNGIVNKQAKITEQQKGVTNFVYKNWYVFLLQK
jgi:hypothetical protein